VIVAGLDKQALRAAIQAELPAWVGDVTRPTSMCAVCGLAVVGRDGVLQHWDAGEHDHDPQREWITSPLYLGDADDGASVTLIG